MSIKIVSWNPRGFEEIRQSDKTLAEVSRVAADVSTKAGNGYKSAATHGRKGPSPSWNKRRGAGYQGRARAIVYPKTFRAMRDNAKNNTLVKLMGGPGGY